MSLASSPSCILHSLQVDILKLFYPTQSFKASSLQPSCPDMCLVGHHKAAAACLLALQEPQDEGLFQGMLGWEPATLETVAIISKEVNAEQQFKCKQMQTFPLRLHCY